MIFLKILFIYHCSHHYHFQSHSCQLYIVFIVFCYSISCHHSTYYLSSCSFVCLSVSSTDCHDWELHFIRLQNSYILTDLRKLIKFIHIILSISFILIHLVCFIILHYYIYFTGRIGLQLHSNFWIEHACFNFTE